MPPWAEVVDVSYAQFVQTQEVQIIENTLETPQLQVVDEIAESGRWRDRQQLRNF